MKYPDGRREICTTRLMPMYFWLLSMDANVTLEVPQPYYDAIRVYLMEKETALFGMADKMEITRLNYASWIGYIQVSMICSDRARKGFTDA